MSLTLTQYVVTYYTGTSVLPFCGGLENLASCLLRVGSSIVFYIIRFLRLVGSLLGGR